MRRALTGAALVLLLVAGVACGDPSGGGGTQQQLTAMQAAASAVEDAGSSRIHMIMTMGAEAGPRVSASMEGAFDYEDLLGKATMTMLSAGTDADIPGEDSPSKLIIEGTFVYMKGAAATAYGASGNGWARMDMSDMPGVSAQMNQDPSQYIDYLRAAGADVEEAGTLEVRGTRTTHYTTELAFEDLAGEGGARESMEMLEEMGVEVGPVTLEAWIDDEGLPRRIRSEMEMTGFPGVPDDVPLTVEVSMDLFDYGVEVDVKTPKKFEEVAPPTP